MIYFALREADAVSDTFKRWFDAGDAQNVKSVFLKMFDPSCVREPTTLIEQLASTGTLLVVIPIDVAYGRNSLLTKFEPVSWVIRSGGPI